MQITVNGDTVVMNDDATLDALLQKLSLGEARVAVELNGNIVPRSQHPHQSLQDGDILEIVHAIGGG
ncbi:MAG: sulfur carrier protein ThiS [Pseudomonas sp.]